MSSSDKIPARWEKLDEHSIATTRIFDLRSIRYRHPVRRTERDFYVIQAPAWVNVLALTPDHQLVLVNQFRFGIDRHSLEIPGGIVDAGEDPLAAGIRELAEETGFVGKNARVLGCVHPNPAILSNTCHLVLIEETVRSASLGWDADEEIEVLTEPVDQVYDWAREGRITHSLVLSALLHFAPVWRKLRGNS
jgi:ADP-ribose pyrophosphatase